MGTNKYHGTHLLDTCKMVTAHLVGFEPCSKCEKYIGRYIARTDKDAYYIFWEGDYEVAYLEGLDTEEMFCIIDHEPSTIEEVRAFLRSEQEKIDAFFTSLQKIGSLNKDFYGSLDL